MSKAGRDAPIFLIVGAEHKTAPRLLADRLQGDAVDMLRLLRACRQAGIDQAMALLTCERCEIWCQVADDGAAFPILAAILAEAADLDIDAIVPQLTSYVDGAALRHAFAVAASLESQVIGEPQVLGQVKEAHRFATRLGMMGSDLDRILRGAIAAGGRVRTETDIATQSVSEVAAVIALTRQVHGDLAPLSGLLIGEGGYADYLVTHLIEAGIARWSMLHPDPHRAQAWALDRDAKGDTLAKLNLHLPAADILIAALEAPNPIIQPDQIAAALKARRRRPMLLIDLATPGDVAPVVGDLDDAYLYGLGDLERLVMQGRTAREKARSAAWALIDDGLAGFERELDRHARAPLLAALAEHFAAERRALLAEEAGLDAAEATRRLVNRLLHRPLSALRAEAADPRLAAAAKRLFALDDRGEKSETS